MGKAIATLAGLAAAAVVSAVHASPIGTTWSQFHFNAAHTGANPQERTLGPGNVGRLAQAWSRATGAAVESSAAVSGGMVYVGSDDGRLHAYDTANGTERWVAGLEGESTLVGSPAVAGGAVLVLTSSSLVQAFDATSGAPLWSRPVSAVEGLFPGSPTVAANVVYAVDAASGRKAVEARGRQVEVPDRILTRRCARSRLLRLAGRTALRRLGRERKGGLGEEDRRDRLLPGGGKRCRLRGRGTGGLRIRRPERQEALERPSRRRHELVSRRRRRVALRQLVRRRGPRLPPALGS